MKGNKNRHTAELAGASPRKATISPCRILVVDQNSDLRLLYTDALASPRCRVDVAEDGATAWEALQSRRYHLLLTENEPPNLTGDELIAKLRSARMVLPVVLASGGRPMHKVGQNPSFQFAATLLKPFDLDALLYTVKNVLRAAIPVCKHPRRPARRSGHNRTPFIIQAHAYENAN
jgi:DNA-binding NtrC family response regulator